MNSENKVNSESDANVLEFTHRGELTIGSVTIQCFVGKDKNGKIKRVISGRSLTKAIGMKGRGPGARARLAKHSTLLPYFSDSLVSAIEHPIQIVGGTGSRKTKPTDGYEAVILHDICQAILSARKAGVLKTPAEQRYGIESEILIRSFAKVGIIALIDEATGYQGSRNRDELQQILSLYIAEELRPWVKTFPDEYYKELFRLKGWQYSPLHTKRPKLIGKITNEIIYERLPPGVLEKLQELNPLNENGNRPHKLHQGLKEFGSEHLSRHLAAIVAFMRASPNWRFFMRLLNRAYPPRKEFQPELFEEDEE